MTTVRGFDRRQVLFGLAGVTADVATKGAAEVSGPDAQMPSSVMVDRL